MVVKSLVLRTLMLAIVERRVVQPLSCLESVLMMVARLVLRDSQDVGVLGCEGAHAVDCAVDCGKVFGVLFAEIVMVVGLRYAIPRGR